MRFVDEYRDPAAARALVARITELAGDGHHKFMEICGGHTHTIYRHGIEHLLPTSVELVHGPGCPVCVIPMGRIDDAIAVAQAPGVIFTSFGDMMRVPGSNGSLLGAKAQGADVRIVYSPLDALRVAVDNPQRPVVFFAVGFETTAPSTAATVLKARQDGVTNFSVFSNHVTIVPPIRAILESPDLSLDGFIGPGHVSTVVGQRPYRFVAGGVRQAVRDGRLRAARHPPGDSDADDPDQRGSMLCREPVHALRERGGNPRALAIMDEVFEVRPHFEWRGLGFIPESALKLQTGVRRMGRGASFRGSWRPRRRSEGLPVRRGPEGCHQAVGVQGVRHRLHSGDPDRHLHGLLRGCVRRLLQLRAPAQGSRRHHGRRPLALRPGPISPGVRRARRSPPARC